MTIDDEQRAAIHEKLAAIWKSSKPTIIERLTTLETSCERWRISPRDTTARHSAHDAAHKLAGVLGTFGLQRGSQIASELEVIVTQPESDPPASLPEMLAELRAMILAKE
jgi:HPt (histidine-containing phosphotransfer) domain-containing protein